jgi:hypothetical protein
VLEKDLDPRASEEGAAGASERLRVLAGPGFGLLVADTGLAELGCAPLPVARAALARVVLAAEDELGVDAELAVVLTTRELGCPNIHYLALANDIRGIGYAHVDARELFDDTPGHRLEGIAFLNDWPYWQTRPAELESAFAHELGHRWGARMHADIQGVARSALLGREQNHWSYYFDSAGSPLEGNVWREESESSALRHGGPLARPSLERVAPTVRGEPIEIGRAIDLAALRWPNVYAYASDTPSYPDRFSPFDLYAMGVLPPERVSPATLLLEPSGGGVDCRGAPVSAASPPQTCRSVTLAAQAASVSIEDAIAVEGSRWPPAENGPRSVDLVVLMLHESNAEWPETHCIELERAASALRFGFERAARGLMQLENVIAGGLHCADLVRVASEPVQDGAIRPPLPPAPASCALTAAPPRGYLGALAGCLAPCAAAWLRRRVRRPRRAHSPE